MKSIISFMARYWLIFRHSGSGISVNTGEQDGVVDHHEDDGGAAGGVDPGQADGGGHEAPGGRS